MNKIQRIKNKWQFILCFTKTYNYLPPKKVFNFGIFNIHTFSSEGETLWNKHYKGFIIQHVFKRNDWKKIKKI